MLSFMYWTVVLIGPLINWSSFWNLFIYPPIFGSYSWTIKNDSTLYIIRRDTITSNMYKFCVLPLNISWLLKRGLWSRLKLLSITNCASRYYHCQLYPSIFQHSTLVWSSKHQKEEAIYERGRFYLHIQNVDDLHSKIEDVWWVKLTCDLSCTNDPMNGEFLHLSRRFRLYAVFVITARYSEW